MNRKIVGCTFVLLALFCAHMYRQKAADMLALNFEVGENIVQTAKKSGAPRFNVDNVDGLISYQLNRIPPDVDVVYSLPGHEITSKNVFAVALYADTKLSDNTQVQAFMMQYSTDFIKTHEDARKAVAELINQFRRANWARYLDEYCPAVTGRSAYLDENGSVSVFESCPLDPDYFIPISDWLGLMTHLQTFQWVAKGVLATLTLRYSSENGGIIYSIDLDFEDYTSKKNRLANNKNQELSEGDKNGWNSTAKNIKTLALMREKIAVLERSAAARGDNVIMRK